jgi:hypothetical protein
MRSLVAVVMVGCGFAPRASTTTAIDADLDGPQLLIDAPVGCVTYSTQFDSCAVGAGSNADLVLTGNSKYDTDTNTLVLDNGISSHPPHVVINTATGSVDVLFVGRFMLSGTFRVTGTLPFGIAAASDVQILGTLDLSNDGAGARSDTDCKTALSLGLGGMNDNGGGGGGGGGGFHGAGGAGGLGDKDGGNSAGGGAGGATARPPGLLGGCDGGKAGDGMSSNAGNAGDGGGAVLLATPSTITVSSAGVIDVGGGGGHRGTGNGGGGGGGASAGMILLECAMLHYAGAIVANGGGGGEGADGTQGNDGANGTHTSMRAMGGAGNSPEGADGADGGAGPTNDGLPATQLKNGGGGGGGGGTGFIAIKAGTIVDNGGTISPAFASWP